MSLNGFFARAGMWLGKLVPSFGFGGGQQQVTQFFGCSIADNEPASAAAIANASPFRIGLLDDPASSAALEVEPAVVATLGNEKVGEADPSKEIC